MNRLSIEKRTQIISALVEGTAINATARMTGVSKVTILKLLKDVGEASAMKSGIFAMPKKRMFHKKRVEFSVMGTCGLGRQLMLTRNFFVAG